MKAYQPQCKITLIKTRSREFVAPEIKTAYNRYQGVGVIDLTPYLSDGGVRLQKSIRDPAGAFSISLNPRLYSDQAGASPMLETLDMLIEPMDMIEIRMAREAPFRKFTEEDRRDWPPVVMRGFVSQVSRSDSIASGVPQRSIVVSGQDYGKLLQIIRIYYINNSHIGDNILHGFAFFEKFAPSNSARNKSVEDFVNDLIGYVINPYLAELSSLVDDTLGMPKAFVAEVTATGCVTPFGMANANDMTLHQMLSSFADVGPFNEMYVEDHGTIAKLILRPIPALDVNGWMMNKDKAPDSIELGLGDVVSSQLSRSDSGVYNYFDVVPSSITWLEQQMIKNVASESSAVNPVQFKTLNQEASIYGERKISANTALNSPALIYNDAPTKAEVSKNEPNVMDWISDRRKRLIDLNRDAVVFEHGSLRLKGDGNIRAGMQILIKHSESFTASYYCPSVSHEFVPGSGFFTTVQVERGTAFVESASKKRAPALSRMDAMGVK